MKNILLLIIASLTLSACASERMDGPQASDVQPTKIQQNQAKFDRAMVS